MMTYIMSTSNGKGRGPSLIRDSGAVFAPCCIRSTYRAGTKIWKDGGGLADVFRAVGREENSSRTPSHQNRRQGL